MAKAVKLPEGPQLQINTSFSWRPASAMLGLVEHEFDPVAVFEFYRPDNMPERIPTIVIHEQNESIDVAGEIRKLRRRCWWLTAIVALEMLILLVMTLQP